MVSSPGMLCRHSSANESILLLKSWLARPVQFVYSDHGVLIIFLTLQAADSGTYICEATNAAGQDMAEIALRVQVSKRKSL